LNNELITIDQNGQPVASSRDVAEHFEKRHDHVMRDIDALGKDVPNFGEMFFETELPDRYGRPQRVFLMNRDGFTLLAMGFTGKTALEWKLKYIEAFNTMEQELRQKAARPLSTAQMFQLQAQINVEQEQRLAALEKRAESVTEAFETLALPAVSKDQWQEETNRAVRQMCEKYGLNYQKTIGDMYEELERSAGVNLSVRQKNLRERMKRGGATYAERQAVSKLSIVSLDKKLCEIYTGIVRRKAARLAASDCRAL
jgi:phage regulatory protein, rha family